LFNGLSVSGLGIGHIEMFWSFLERPLRIEFKNAVYHITSRRDERKKIYRGKEDNT